MPPRPCLTCRALTNRGSYCPAHQPVKQPSPSSRATAQPGWNRLRALALQRDGHACVRCRATTRLAVHHRIPVARGGPNALSNLETLCEPCHRAAHK